MLTLAIIILIICFLALSWFAGTDAPYVPTKVANLTEVLKTAKVAQGKRFYELGSGDGRVVLLAAKLGAESFGIEQSWLRVLYSRLQAQKLHLSRAHFYHGNIYHHTYHDADIIFIYMLQPCVDRLEIKLQQELKPKSVVITQRYHFKHLKPYKTIGNFNFYQV